MAVSGNVRKLFEVFKTAIENERASQELYKSAMELCEDDLTRGILKGMYEDEVRHERALIERYNAIRPTVQPDAGI
jgi:rubrerythrin